MEWQWTGGEAQIHSVLAAPLSLDIGGEYTIGPTKDFSTTSSSVWLLCESIELKDRSEPVRVERLGSRAPVERGEAVGERILEPVVRVHQVEVAARPHNPSKP